MLGLILVAAILGLGPPPAAAFPATATAAEPTVLYPAAWYPGVADSAAAMHIVLNPGGSASGLAIPIGRAGGAIRVRVLADDDGSAVPGILVEAARGRFRAVALADAGGVATLSCVPAGFAIVRTRPDDPRSETGAYTVRALESLVHVSDGALTDAGNLRAPRGARIKARVFHPSGPAWIDLPVVLRSADGGFREVHRTGPDGRAHFGGLDPGLYRLWADARGTNAISEAWDGSRDTLASTLLDAAADTLIDGIDMTPDLGGVIEGAVRDEGSNFGLPGLDVQVFSASGPPATYTFVTEEYGYYTADGLPAGWYKVYVPAIRKWYPNATREQDARTVEVVEPQTTGSVNLKGTRSGGCPLPPGTAGTIEGMVTIDFTLLPRARIVAWNDRDTIETTITDGPGYSIDCVSPGSYRAAIYPDGVYRARFYPRVNDPDSAVAFTVARGDTTRQIDFAPERAVTIDGTVTDRDDGTAVAGVPVRAHLALPALTVASMTAEDGSFRFDRLPDGSGLPAGDWTVATDSIAISSDAVVPVRSISLEASHVPGGVRLEFEIPDIAIAGWTLDREDPGHPEVTRAIATAIDHPDGTHARSFFDQGADGSARYRLTIDLGTVNGRIESPWTAPLLPGPGGGGNGGRIPSIVSPIPWDGTGNLHLPSGARGPIAELFSLGGARVMSLSIREGCIGPPRAGDAERLASGVYFLRWRTASGPMRVARIVITR